VHGAAPGNLKDLAQAHVGHQRVVLHGAQPSGQHFAQHRVLGQLVGRRGIGQGFALELVQVAQQGGGGHAFRAKAPKAFDDQRQGQHRAGDQRPDGPASGL